MKDIAQGARSVLLTEGQRECLRLVAELRTSRQIAQQLRISPNAVDARIRRSIEVLGVGSRAEAARLLVSEEEFHNLLGQPVISNYAGFPTTSRLKSSDTIYPILDDSSLEQHQLHDSFHATDLYGGASELDYYDTSGPVDNSLWITKNRLSITYRVMALFVIASISAVAFSGLISGLSTLKNIVP